MKCPKCRRDMNKVTDGNHNYWWICPECQTTVGKKEEKKQEEESSDQP